MKCVGNGAIVFTLSPELASHTAPSPTLHINERVNQMWAEGRQLWHLGFGESRFPVHPKLQSALGQNAGRKSYLPAQGLPALRTAIAAFYTRQLGINASGEQIIVAPGSKALIFALQMAMQAQLILPTPSWVSYAPQARLLGRSVQTIPATIADHYRLSVDALEKVVSHLDAGPKILLLNSPNNPSGAIFEADLLREIASFCEAHQIVVLSDEIYGLVNHAGDRTPSIAQFYPQGTVILGGISKHLSLGGWRLGSALLPATDAGERLMLALRVVAGEIWSTPAAPVQYAALAAYAEDPEIQAYVAECSTIHALRTRHLWSWLVELGIDCPEPQGAFYLIANFDRWRPALRQLGIESSTQLSEYLLDIYSLATLPGVAFGIPDHELSLRLSTSYLDMEDDAGAASLLAAWRSGAGAEALMRDHHPQMNGAIRRFGDFVHRLDALQSG